MIALFQGHTHRCNVDRLGAAYGNKKLLHTGNFSYTAHRASVKEMRESFWGFRDIVTVGSRSVSRYIVAESQEHESEDEQLGVQSKADIIQSPPDCAQKE